MTGQDREAVQSKKKKKKKKGEIAEQERVLTQFKRKWQVIRIKMETDRQKHVST